MYYEENPDIQLANDRAELNKYRKLGTIKELEALVENAKTSKSKISNTINPHSKSPKLKRLFFQLGYVVECRNGAKYCVIRDDRGGGQFYLVSVLPRLFISLIGWEHYNDYDENLLRKDGKHEWDIVKVYRHPKDETPIWQREEILHEITVEEAEKALNNGYVYRDQVKIVCLSKKEKINGNDTGNFTRD